MSAVHHGLFSDPESAGSPFATEPIVTVAIPVCNGAATIARAIRSVATQRYMGWMEILVCDDGSTDKTSAILAELAQDEPRLRILRHDRNLGRPYARNHLIAEAAGRYLTWLDADDEKYPDQVWYQVQSILHHEARQKSDRIFVYTAYLWRFEERKEEKIVNPKLGKNQLADILAGRFGSYLWSVLGRTAAYRQIGGFDPHLPRLQDMDLFIRASALGYTFVSVATPKALCVYYKSDEGTSGKQVAAAFRRIRRKHRLWYSIFGTGFRLQCLSRHHYTTARFCQTNGERVRALYFTAVAKVSRLIGDVYG